MPLVCGGTCNGSESALLFNEFTNIQGVRGLAYDRIGKHNVGVRDMAHALRLNNQSSSSNLAEEIPLAIANLTWNNPFIPTLRP